MQPISIFCSSSTSQAEPRLACDLAQSVHGLLQKYTNHDIVKYLESIGAEFGACQNAYTSADDTVYEFLVPTDDEEVLENSFAVFAEFATKIRCVLRLFESYTEPVYAVS